MDNFILRQKIKLQENIDLLDELLNNLEQFNNLSNKDIYIKKLIGYEHNIDIINDNTLDLLNDIYSNKSTISNTTCELINDNIKVNEFINEIKPLLTFCFFNRDILTPWRTPGTS